MLPAEMLGDLDLILCQVTPAALSFGCNGHVMSKDSISQHSSPSAGSYILYTFSSAYFILWATVVELIQISHLGLHTQ